MVAYFVITERVLLKSDILFRVSVHPSLQGYFT
jgi:hypothetical protein